MQKKIVELSFNWRQENFNGEAGENFDKYEVGKGDVIEIIDQRMNEQCYIVNFSTGMRVDIFNPNVVVWKDV